MRKMRKKFQALFFLLLLVSAPGLCLGASAFTSNDDCVDFSTMTRLWCTVDYKHWAKNYANIIDYTEVDFYLYLDEAHKKVYNEHKEEMAEVLAFEDKEIKFVNKYHANKRTYTENYTLDRYTGRAKGKGTIRHDYGGWASLTYENRDFNANGQCGVIDNSKKF